MSNEGIGVWVSFACQVTILADLCFGYVVRFRCNIGIASVDANQVRGRVGGRRRTRQHAERRPGRGAGRHPVS